MPRDLKALFREAFQLPENERATLAGLLIESLEPFPDPDVEKAWAEEAERRWKEIESGAVRTIPWEEVRAKLFRRAEASWLSAGSARAADEAISVRPRFTRLQGQYLAFVAAYTRLNRRPPAEADIQRYFQVSPPSVHNMILTLDKRGLITRIPGQARSIEVLVPYDQLPALD